MHDCAPTGPNGIGFRLYGSCIRAYGFYVRAWLPAEMLRFRDLKLIGLWSLEKPPALQIATDITELQTFR